MKHDCLFCKMIKHEIPCYTIYEDDIVMAFLDINPDTLGHLLIIPKQHYTDLFDIDDKTLLHIHQIVKQLYPLLKDRLNCQGLTTRQNNGIIQDIKHYHLHLIPRYDDSDITYIYKKPVIDAQEVYQLLTKKD